MQLSLAQQSQSACPPCRERKLSSSHPIWNTYNFKLYTSWMIGSQSVHNWITIGSHYWFTNRLMIVVRDMASWKFDKPLGQRLTIHSIMTYYVKLSQQWLTKIFAEHLTTSEATGPPSPSWGRPRPTQLSELSWFTQWADVILLRHMGIEWEVTQLIRSFLAKDT